MRKLFAALAAGVLLLSAGTINPVDSKNQFGASAQIGSADVWTTYATEKILADKDYGEQTECAIDVSAARGEYESYQIILTAKTADVEYTVEKSDLTTTGGDVFSKDAIEIYGEKYIPVTTNFENNGYEAGLYPDCLLPYEQTVKYGENVISKGNNGGLYVTFNVNSDQKPGKYSGNIIVKVGNEQTSVPVTLNVADLNVSETVNTKSIFLNQWNYYSGELNSSQEMLDAYTQKLIDYRLAPDIIVTDSLNSEEDIAYYTQHAYEFMKDPRCSNITIPYSTEYVDGQQCIDAKVFKQYLRKFAEKSFKENFNMLAKSICYFGIIDEPQHNSLLERTKVVCNVFRSCKEAVASEIENDSSISSEIKQEVVDSIRALKNVVTCAYAKSYAPYVDTWCPQVEYYDGEALRNDYADQDEKWWYTCISPRAPYPTYHIDDTLLSARSMGWMQAQYDVTGNLFWATNIYAQYNGKNYVNIEDYYSQSASRFPNVNGDGFLFYPGKKYGLTSPLGSLRLEAIRDGLEEYELLNSLKGKYAAIGETTGYPDAFTNLMQSLSAHVYSGTRVNTDSELFASSRAKLYKYAELSQSDCSLTLLDYNDDKMGNITQKLFVADGYAVKKNGTEISDAVNVKGGKVYTVKNTLSEQVNYLNLTIEGKKTFTLNEYLGGRVARTAAESIVVSRESSALTKTLVDASSFDSRLSGKIISIVTGANEEDDYQNFRIVCEEIKAIGVSSDKMILRIYYNGNDNPDLKVSAKYNNAKLYNDIKSATLKNGENTIEIPLGALNVANKGGFDYLVLYVGSGSAAESRSFGLYEAYFYNK